MENKEGLRLLILMFLCIGLVATINATETPSAVKVFYGGMETLSTLPSTSDPEVISQIEPNMQKCFYGPENSGINLQNDFRFFNIDKKSP